MGLGIPLGGLGQGMVFFGMEDMESIVVVVNSRLYEGIMCAMS